MNDTRGLFTQTVARPDPNHSFPPFPSHHQALLERISDGVLADDRRSAAHELRDLVQESRVAQFAIGVIGLPTLITSLTEERNDTELVHGVLEVLVNALTGGVAGVDGGADTAVREGGEGAHLAHAGAANADAFVRNPANLELALSLLDEEDFYVRYHTMQLLTALSATNPFEVQSAIMSNPTGVGRLMDNLTEREVIRNETLLLLISLTRGSEDLRKIVAFEGAFERCFNVIREEGAADGGIIVQDCLELCNNLLRGSPSNQSFFRESSFLHQLPEMLSLKVPSQAKGGPPLAPRRLPICSALGARHHAGVVQRRRGPASPPWSMWRGRRRSRGDCRKGTLAGKGAESRTRRRSPRLACWTPFSRCPWGRGGGQRPGAGIRAQMPGRHGRG